MRSSWRSSPRFPTNIPASRTWTPVPAQQARISVRLQRTSPWRRSPQALDQEWMHSPPHRANILDPRMDTIGVGLVKRGGNYYAVEDFAYGSRAWTAAD